MHRYTCPVCGWPDLYDDPIKHPYSEEICPSCWFQFGYSHSEGETFDSWRETWIAGGMNWSGKGIAEPPDWNPIQQLLNVGIQVPSE